MKKKKNKKRVRCDYCGSRRYVENMKWVMGGQFGYTICKNNDLCVLKMSYNKKRKKLCKKL